MSVPTHGPLLADGSAAWRDGEPHDLRARCDRCALASWFLLCKQHRRRKKERVAGALIDALAIILVYGGAPETAAPAAEEHVLSFGRNRR